ncbi:predicted protein [Plenodomus lingam JN3]|uniref:Predicted protein n=1 Tax=Leptosphaeria maculans (strain JN3 / isolate v23.1.3 / race Av1-4-5-6-7-8) TaxID=985895 RepID=E4ZPZ4_LEPMJ|nr:predicted protein [Plenodomus lingam JN3]CBX93529.1 predicted protein [Plenodomus lingam JN3]
MARPWTPPHTDTDVDHSTSHHHYFTDPYRPAHGEYTPVTEPRWSSHRGAAAKEDEYKGVGVRARCDTPTEHHHHHHHHLPVHHALPTPKSAVTAPVAVPYTPTKSQQQVQHSGLHYGNAQAQGLPRYPYTPDSTRIPRRQTERTLSPVPWDTHSSHSSSPVQHALSSCIVHFENLLQTREPDEDQMEYIVGQLEAMANYLSSHGAPFQIIEEQVSTNGQLPTDEQVSTAPEEIGPGSPQSSGKDKVEKEMSGEYIAEVGRYIEGVRGYATNLKSRLDEVKMLNSIQLDVIKDLRSQVQTVTVGLQAQLRADEDKHAAEEDEDEVEDEVRIEDEEEDCPADAYSRHRQNKGQRPREFGLDSQATLINPSLPSSQILSPPPPPPPSSPILAKSSPTLSLKPHKYQFLDPSPAPAQPHITPTSQPTHHHHHHHHHEIITIIRTPPKRSFWASFATALDQFGDLFYEQTGDA